jgi:hypothetical protein
LTGSGFGTTPSVMKGSTKFLSENKNRFGEPELLAELIRPV